MKRVVVLLLLIAALPMGCASPRTNTRPLGAVVGTAHGRTGANLALGVSGGDVWEATGLNYRSPWPYVNNGYRVDEVTYHTQVQDDDQFEFGRLGGFYRTDLTVRNAVVIH